MTTPRSQPTEQKRHQRFVLPDPPDREPEDTTSFDHLTLNGGAHTSYSTWATPRPPWWPAKGT